MLLGAVFPDFPVLPAGFFAAGFEDLAAVWVFASFAVDFVLSADAFASVLSVLAFSVRFFLGVTVKYITLIAGISITMDCS